MYGIDCHNVQHEGGVSQKNVKDTVGDISRTKIFKFGEYGRFVHDFFLEPLFQTNTEWFAM